MADHSGGPRSNISAFKEQEEYLNQVYLFCYTSGISLPLTFINAHCILCVNGKMLKYEHRNCGEYTGLP